MDTNWCTFCGKHIDCIDDDALLYCSEACRHNDAHNGALLLPLSTTSSSGTLSPSPSTEYFSFKASSLNASPTGSPVWAPQMLFRNRSPSLTPVGALDLSTRHPCHAPAYSPSSRTSSAMLLPPSSLGPSAMDARNRAASLPYSHQLSAM
ncbi:hypothetical protein GGI25_004438 [Coemansia spiralis]|uniref:Uncharacterized protein n=2 Tax=Coemansia TaxID=4863 RepID=A0A9W8G0G1_9FUNG|nr:hypothetical protein BX070DRAFT_236077 [Coemansia spiralis]KAJ1995803.1 hypothetical protein EDC05_000461 [Coemansia umbellata]KAJ2625892.1 hypothetical protein GGI26_000355 [Coemansia sp. RSA 1358]KAJ2674221.1 hypothetical protein GGI25_004438 [Coemansia spiralis]